MKKVHQNHTITFAILAAWLAVSLVSSQPHILLAREKQSAVDPNDVTLRLYQLLDDSHDGKLTEFYVLADKFKDKDSKDEELQHVLRVDYDKNRSFGRLNLHVRSVAQLTPEQLKTYSPKQIYDFGAEDTEKFVKGDPGQLGRTGDVYLRATADRPPSSSPVTEEARREYEFYLSQYVLPALQKR